jgi:hypothetical protein
MSMPHAKQPDLGPCPVILPCLPLDADSTAVCAPGYSGRKRGEVVRTRTVVLQMHTRQWIGTYAGRGNGDYCSELTRALQSITTYLKQFVLTPEVAQGESRWALWRRGSHGSPRFRQGCILSPEQEESKFSSIKRSKGYWLIPQPRV